MTTRKEPTLRERLWKAPCPTCAELLNAIEQAEHVLAIKRENSYTKACDIGLALGWLRNALKRADPPAPAGPTTPITHVGRSVTEGENMKTVARAELSNLRMAAGGENRYSIVVDGDTVKKWVGIGWIDLRKATAKDRRTLPIVVPNAEAHASATEGSR